MAFSWSTATIPATTGRKLSVVWADTLGLFVVLVEGNSTSRIMTSPDGTTWTTRTTPDQPFEVLGWDTTIGRLVLVGEGINGYAYSTDGINWSGAGSPGGAYDTAHKFTVASNGTIYVSFSGDNGSDTSNLMTGNGTSWSAGTSIQGQWRACAWSPALSLFAAVGYDSGLATVQTSPDGTSWTERIPSDNVIGWNSIVWSPELAMFIAISEQSEATMTSTDGTTWTVNTSVPYDGNAFKALSWSPALGRATALNGATSGTSAYLTTTDGLTWEVGDTGLGNVLMAGSAWSPNINRWLFVGESLSSDDEDAVLGIYTDMAETTGWYKSDVPGLDTGVDASIVSGASARPNGPRGQIIVSPFTATRPLYGFPGHAVAVNNRMIYAAGDYTVATDLPPIRTWNGTSDYLLARVPRDGSGNIPKAITTIINGDGNIYLGTWDYGTSNADVAGRILKLDPNSGQLTNVGNVNTLTGYIPQALCFHNGELWAGLGRSDTSAGKIYRIKPAEQTTWTQDRDMTTDSVGGCTAIVSYKGQMYFGSSAASGTFAKFGSRNSSGTYGLVYTGTGGTAADYNGFYAACVFGDNLYFSYWNPDATEISLIKKYDGSTVTTALDVTTVDDLPIIGLFVHDGVLYAIGSRVTGGTTYESVLLTSVDGTTWVNRTGDLPLGTFSSRGLTNAFATIAY